jgi:ribosome-binding protein aMBF1 (putative translation factor)
MKNGRARAVPISVAMIENLLEYLLFSKHDDTMATVSETIRQAIRKSPMSCYQIAKQAKMSESQLSRFLSGQSGLTIATLDRLAPVLGLKLTKVKHNP